MCVRARVFVGRDVLAKYVSLEECASNSLFVFVCWLCMYVCMCAYCLFKSRIVSYWNMLCLCVYVCTCVCLYPWAHTMQRLVLHTHTHMHACIRTYMFLGGNGGGPNTCIHTCMYFWDPYTNTYIFPGLVCFLVRKRTSNHRIYKLYVHTFLLVDVHVIMQAHMHTHLHIYIV